MLDIHRYFLIIFLATCTVYNSRSQETINAADPSSFILGGGQESTTAILNLQPIAITDLETESIPGGSNTTNILEAGNPFEISGATGQFWLNFTYRSESFQNARIYASANQPIPDGIAISLQIINTAGANGIFTATPLLSPIDLLVTEQAIVFDFPSGYTGDGEGSGYLIEYNITNPNLHSLPTGFEIVFEIR